MTREEAINEIKSWDFLEGKEIEAIHTLIPDLAESEDKRMVVKIARTLSFAAAHNLIIDYDELIAMQNWLEKQKNLDKMIVVSPEVWDKAIADAYENGKKDGKKQKEQKPNILQNAFDKSKKGYTLEEKSKASDYAESILPTSIMYGESKEEYKLHTIIEAAFIAGQKEQKPEWSDKDDHILNNIYDFVAENTIDINRAPCAKECLDWLKSLRPSWKPSEEQMEAFKKYIEEFQARAEAAVGGWNNFDVMIQLYEQLKKL